MAECDDVNYAVVNFVQSSSRKKQERKKESEDVIYSTVTSSKEGSESGISPSEGQSKPKDPSLTLGSKVKAGNRTCRRSMMLLLFLLLLLSVISLGVVSYFFKKMEDQKKQEEHHCQLSMQLEKQLNDAKEAKMQLESKLSDLQKEALKNCTAGWEYFSGKCYYFSTDMKNWAESRDACVTMGGHLVIIETEEEQDFLSRQNPTLPNRYWIGLTDSAKEGEWRWVDNGLLNDNAKYWWGHEPDDWKGTADRPLPEGEDCAEMFVNGVRLSWYDTSCKDSSKRICESKAK
ncbi:hypothetical protein ACEWY4_024985 [Coilia grayii]|uniref:C-type lectin domain-containing protein n=1 Tax=Coilia grayii TaxID=363190 RepID=A0ABD1IW97_9TELE